MRQFQVCVADDCEDEVTVLCEGLKLNNFEAIPAYNGQEALDLCTQGEVDLLLLDVGLPDIDGYEVCRRLKANPQTRDIPVIFVTARGAAVHVAEGYQLGAVDYIPKPYNLPIVMVRVEAALRTKQHTDLVRSGAVESLMDTCYTDTLTGLRNRRYLMERLQEEVEKAHRYSHPLSCVVLDVDEVQALDLDLGPASQEDLLMDIALAMRKTSRNYDILARYDASLFAAVLPHSPIEDAIRYAERIQAEMKCEMFSDPPTSAVLTFGIVSCRNGSARLAEELFGEAMRGLLQAKSQPEGRIYARNLDPMLL